MSCSCSHSPCSHDVESTACDLEASFPGFARQTDEGIACYMMRLLNGGQSGNFTIVTNVRYQTPNILQTQQSFTFTQGILTAVGTPVESIVATAEAC